MLCPFRPGQPPRQSGRMPTVFRAGSARDPTSPAPGHAHALPACCHRQRCAAGPSVFPEELRYTLLSTMLSARYARSVHGCCTSHNGDRMVQFRQDDVCHPRRGPAHGHGGPRRRHQASRAQDGRRRRRGQGLVEVRASRRESGRAQRFGPVRHLREHAAGRADAR